MKNAIYILICPLTNEIRYVGKAKCVKNRLGWHLQRKNRKVNTHKNHWINKILDLGLKPEVYVVENLPAEELFEAEKFWIAYYRSIGCRLTNGTDGGEGALGRKNSPETIAKMSASAKLIDRSNFVPHNKQQHYIIFGVELRKCKICKESKSLDNYTKRTPTGKSRQNYCKECRAEYQRSYREENPLSTLTTEEHAAIRAENHKKASATLKQHYINNPEAKELLRKQRSKAIQGVNVLTGEVITFDSALKAKEAGFQNSNIGQAIKLNKSYRGYNWKFL